MIGRNMIFRVAIGMDDALEIGAVLLAGIETERIRSRWVHV